VLRDLSHELDYLSWLLGECQGVFALGGRLGSVTDDSDDAWGIIARHERAPIVTLQLNYLDTQKRRRIVLNTSSGTIEADLVASTIRVNGVEESFDSDRNSSYRAMHEAMLNDPKSHVATAGDGIVTDQTIAMIERSASDRRWVERG
jgi:predicted dehydrogenase